ncbi:MAG: PhoH family protein [Allobaculum sp.]
MEFKLDCSELPYDVLIALPGFQDDNFRLIEQAFPVKISMKSSEIRLESSQEIVFHQVESVLDAMVQKIAKDGSIEKDEIERLCYLASRGHDLTDEFSDEKPVVKTKSGKVIFPKTANQKRLVHAFRNQKITFASGVAGTGKTYLAVAYAVDQLKRGKIEKIILTRPAVEAGESLGFLPGDMKEKVDPYLRPLYDALNEMLGPETVERYQEKEIIEIAPLAFMRGRTLNDAVVILDEAQNTTKSQMKMFLTRMGRNCRMIINGDISQIDLIRKADSGLIQACQILQGIDGIAIQYLDQSDVVRNPLVQKIIERYEQVDQ